jgi:hypothetical protein
MTFNSACIGYNCGGMKRKASNKKKTTKKTKELAVFSCRDSAYETLAFISKDAG